MTRGPDMVDVEEAGDDPDPHRFPLSPDDILKIGKVTKLVRSQLSAMTPNHLRSAAALLRALERLPVTTPGIEMTFGFMQRNTDGNYGWADITISGHEITLGVGEHFYDPGVGGDTESRDIFAATAGGNTTDGDIDDWIEVATVISAEGEVDVEDYSDYDAIDWASEE